MLQFSKYQGLGNDFLMVDARESGEDDLLGLSPERIQRLCDRRFGVGADGVILALPARGSGELRMRIFNADGSEPEMCGNGIRCLARFLADSDGDSPGRSWPIETLAGLIVPELQADGSIRVDMGSPYLNPEQVPTTLPVGGAGLPQGRLRAGDVEFAVGAAGMGNPHVVIPVEDLNGIDLEGWGAALEVDPAFPAKTNVHFVQVLSPSHLRMQVWERGAGPTLACGTGACATLVVCHRLGLAQRSAQVDLPGGPLLIDWNPDNDHIFMTGPAESVFDAVITPGLWGGEPLGVGDTTTLSPPEDTPGGDGAAGHGSSIDCATACVNGCQQPDNCAAAEARAQVEALLASSSLDELVSLATNSLEARTRARFERQVDLNS